MPSSTCVPFPPWEQDHDDVGSYHCISLMLSDGAQITECDCTRIARRRVPGPVVRIDVALAFQGLRDVPDVDDIPKARRDIKPFQTFCLLIGTAIIVPYRAGPVHHARPQRHPIRKGKTAISSCDLTAIPG